MTPSTVTRHTTIARCGLDLLLPAIEQELGRRSLRLAGVAHVKEAPDMPAVIQGTQNMLHTWHGWNAGRMLIAARASSSSAPVSSLRTCRKWSACSIASQSAWRRRANGPSQVSSHSDSTSTAMLLTLMRRSLSGRLSPQARCDKARALHRSRRKQSSIRFDCRIWTSRRQRMRDHALDGRLHCFCLVGELDGGAAVGGLPTKLTSSARPGRTTESEMSAGAIL